LPILSIRVLVVDHYEPFRQILRSILQNTLPLVTIVDALDGVEAIELAQSLQPHIILLDVGLPKTNGIDAARRIRELAPHSKILFVSQETSLEIVQAAFSAGATGYVTKMDAGSELPTAMKTVLRGERFVGNRFAGHGFSAAPDSRTPRKVRDGKIVTLPPPRIEIAPRHEAGFYSDDAILLDDLTQFVDAALKAGNAAIVVATQ
jgi:DNA-binding NarL/FixJ family response regulator